MKKIIVTGFPPFGEYQENSSSLLGDEFSKLHAFEVEFYLAPIRLFTPDAYNFGNKIVNRALDFEADAIISLGMSSSARGIRIESMATNWAENEKYCLSHENKRKVSENYDSHFPYYVNLQQWDLEQIFLNFQDIGIAHENVLSNDANNFCCNAVMFRILAALNEMNCRIPYLFVHTPCTKKATQTIPGFDPSKVIMNKQELKNAFVILASFFKAK